jgi:hypothetical protein
MDPVGMAGNASTAPTPWSCSITASSTTSASLSTSIKLVAAIIAASAVTSNLSTSVRLQASLQAVSTVSTSGFVNSIQLVSLISSAPGISGTLTSAQIAPTFTPSAARTIFVEATAPVFTGSKWWNLTDTKKPRGLKDPDATIDLTFDWSDWLNDIGSAVISDVTFTVTGANNVNVFNDNTTATIFISGGVVGTASTVACKIQTNTTPARTDERTVYIDIADE